MPVTEKQFNRLLKELSTASDDARAIARSIRDQAQQMRNLGQSINQLQRTLADQSPDSIPRSSFSKIIKIVNNLSDAVKQLDN